MKRSLFLILFMLLIVNFGYSQCTVEISGPNFICSDGASSHQLQAVGSFSSYLWSPGGEVTQSIQVSSPGEYMVTATDATGCQAVAMHVVNNAPAIIPNIQLSSEYVCLGDNVHMTVSGAGPGGSYYWSNGIGGGQVKDLVVSIPDSTTYTVTLTDTYGCTAVGETTVIGLKVPSAQIEPDVATICKGDSIKININSTVVTNGNRSISWFPITGLLSSTEDTVIAVPQVTTSYTVTEINEMGGTTCSNSATAVINVDEYNISTPLHQLVCKGEQVSVYVNQSDGQEPYNYTWDINGVRDSLLDGNNNFPDIIDTVNTYTVTATDGNNCSAIKSFVIEPYPDLELTAYTNLDTVCPGEPVLFNASISGGTGHPYVFMLDGDFSSTVTTLYPNETYDYISMARDACMEVIDTLTIYTYPIPHIDFRPNVFSGCAPLNVNFNSIVTPSNLVQSYAWNFGENDASNYSTLQSPTHIYKRDGVYDVSVGIRTINNCFADTFKTRLISVQPKPNVSFKAEPLRASVLNPTINFINTSEDIAYSTFEWDFGDGEFSDLKSTEHTFDTIGTYHIFLEGTNIFGCSDTISHDVYIIPELKIFVPEAFSPNKDGINEYFEIKGGFISEEGYDLTIWDRNGGIIFSSDSIENSWDGKHEGDGKIVPPGYYYYLLKYQDMYGSEYEKSGSVHVVI